TLISVSALTAGAGSGRRTCECEMPSGNRRLLSQAKKHKARKRLKSSVFGQKENHLLINSVYQ
ncbi:MAG: hypothetical protein LBL15_00115, partial [Oscillospiraceae bacterium]|nr:hypothetical protein [Oscillospiraceae bacterium]